MNILINLNKFNNPEQIKYLSILLNEKNSTIFVKNNTYILKSGHKVVLTHTLLKRQSNNKDGYRYQILSHVLKMSNKYYGQKKIHPLPEYDQAIIHFSKAYIIPILNQKGIINTLTIKHLPMVVKEISVNPDYYDDYLQDIENTKNQFRTFHGRRCYKIERTNTETGEILNIDHHAKSKEAIVYKCKYHKKEFALFYFVTPYVEGTSLGALIRHNAISTYPLAQKIRIIFSIVLKTLRIHETGNIHGDIKPDNLIFNTKTGEIEYIDFETTGSPTAYTFHGPTWGYIPQKSYPVYKHWKTARTIDADIYALGATIGCFLVGYKFINKSNQDKYLPRRNLPHCNYFEYVPPNFKINTPCHVTNTILDHVEKTMCVNNPEPLETHYHFFNQLLFNTIK